MKILKNLFWILLASLTVVFIYRFLFKKKDAAATGGNGGGVLDNFTNGIGSGIADTLKIFTGQGVASAASDLFTNPNNPAVNTSEDIFSWFDKTFTGGAANVPNSATVDKITGAPPDSFYYDLFGKAAARQNPFAVSVPVSGIGTPTWSTADGAGFNFPSPDSVAPWYDSQLMKFAASIVLVLVLVLDGRAALYEATYGGGPYITPATLDLAMHDMRAWVSNYAAGGVFTNSPGGTTNTGMTPATNSGAFALANSVDWSQAGVAGGVPNVTTIFTNMAGLDTNGTADIRAALTNALALCPSNQVISLPAGKFLLTGQIDMQDGVVIRGQGTNTVIIGDYGGVLFSFRGKFWGWVSPASALLGTVSKGATNLTLANPMPGDVLQVGSRFQITESNDTSLVSADGIEGGVGDFAMGQYCKVTAISNGTNVTFWPPLYFTYSNQFQPFIYEPYRGDAPSGNMIDHAGIENLTVSNINSGGTINFQFTWASECWLKNIKSYYGSVEHVQMSETYRCEIRDSLFSGVTAPLTSSRCYGLQLGGPNTGHPTSKVTALLVENNIWTAIRGAVVLGYGAAGCVIGYNYFSNMTNETPTTLYPSIAFHSAHSYMNLVEGNVGGIVLADNFHGSSSHNVIFRNWFSGREQPINTNIVGGMASIEVDAHSPFYSIIGNVLGYAGISNAVAKLTSPAGGALSLAKTPDTSWTGNWYKALMLGYDGPGGGVTLNDTNCYLTATITGNYDYVSGGTTWANNASNSLPASLYLTSKPAWWTNGATVWPAIGPDVSGLVQSIPAQLRTF